MEYDELITHKIDMYMGKPKSGKTLIAGSYPKPLLYLSIGNDGGGRVLATAFKDDYQKGLIKVKNIANAKAVSGKIPQTSIEKLGEIFAELRKPGADSFKTIVIDTVGALQDDEKTRMEFEKQKSLSQQEWGDIAKMMISIKNTMKRFSQEMDVQIVWIFHTSEQEMYETSGLNKELRIVPDVTIKTGVKYMKDASNIFYCCRKTTLDNKGNKTVKFLTYVGPHPLMDTGTRDILLEKGDFVEDFNYNKWQQLVKAGRLDAANVLTIEDSSANVENENEEE